jgi:uncharacterized protein DUF748
MTTATRRRLAWVAGIVAAIAAAAVLVVVAAPWAVRWAATAWAASVTGRPVTAGDVRVRLRDARVEFRNVVIAAPGDEPPLATADRLVIDLRWRPLLGGRVRVERLELQAPVVHIVRKADGTVSIDDVLAHLRRNRTATAPMDIIIERAALEKGRIVFVDRTVARARETSVEALRATFSDLATRGEPQGTGSLDARLAGGDFHVDATAIRLWPFHLRADARASDLNVASVGAYVPSDAPLRPVAGRLSSRARVTIDEEGGTVQGRSTLEQLEVVRAGQRRPFLTAPRLVTTVDGLRFGGATSADRIDIEGSAIIDDSRAQAADGPIQLSRISGTLRNASASDRAPAAVQLDVALPQHGTLTVRGTATFRPLTANLVAAVNEASLQPLAAYIPASSPVQLGTGARIDGELRIRLASDHALHAEGQLRSSQLELYRRDLADPFLIQPRLDVGIDDLSLHNGLLTVRRLSLSGHPTFVDHSVSPPARWEVAEVTGTVTEFSWPSGEPARVKARARLTTGGRSTLEATVRPSPLELNARIRMNDVPATRFNAYLPDGTDVHIARGAVAADIRVDHAQKQATRLTSTMTLSEPALETRDGAPLVSDQAVRLSVRATVEPDGRVAVEQAALDATPVVAGVALRALHVEAAALQWPPTTPARLRATARLPDSGTAQASGTLDSRDGGLALELAVRDAALGPWAPLLNIGAPAAGRLDANVRLSGNYRQPKELRTTGEAAVHDIRIGDADEPTIRVPRLEATGVEIVGRRIVHAATLAAHGPSVVVTRAEGGGFPILRMLGGHGPGEAKDRPSPAITIDRITIEDGNARFVDRTTTPPFSAELRRLSAIVTDLDTRDTAPARVELNAVVGNAGALDLAGSVAPFATPFALDVAGTLTDFRVPSTNPYLREAFGWVAPRGRLTTKLRYRVEGNRLEASNDILVENLAVRRATGEVDPRIGVPLGLVVALLKNARGDIEVSVPVTGNLDRPGFGFGDALARAARRLIGKVVTGPFRAIGRALRGGGGNDITDLRVEPVRFGDGSARLTPEAREHVDRIGDFLAETPGVQVVLRPVVGRGDLHALRREAAIAGVQRYRREHTKEDFDSAARALAGSAPDTDVDTALETIASRQPLPVAAAQELAAARSAATREALAAVAARTKTHVRMGPAAIEREDAEGGRVEIDLAPRNTEPAR